VATVVVPYAPGIAALKVIARNYLTDIAEEVKDASKTLVPVATGNLKNSIVRYSTGSETERIHAMAPYAAYVELGTSSHRIEGNRYLYWTNNRPGYKAHWHPGYTPYRYVNHPGATAQSYLATALDWVAAAHA
jgi:hypothetical protein